MKITNRMKAYIEQLKPYGKGRSSEKLIEDALYFYWFSSEFEPTLIFDPAKLEGKLWDTTYEEFLKGEINKDE